ncbi:hypothetical protein FOL47_003779 [Perkinsus chesapeaki]|uniref:Uncharacterized protein n=1 Tax=Perkinsus chesapeaki TaxID=330153 RepID=A0A7J6MZZ4_PERCH|nr:hypothetical protein FOL47_003779 [Perkinsus chesapeaki]
MVFGGSFMKPPVRYPDVQEDARSPKDAGLISRGDLRQIRGTWRSLGQTCLFYSADRPSNNGLYSYHLILNRSIRRCNEILDVFVPEKPIEECHIEIIQAFKRCENEANRSYPERDIRVKNLTQFRPAFTSREMEKSIQAKIEQDRLDALEEDKYLPITTDLSLARVFGVSSLPDSWMSSPPFPSSSSSPPSTPSTPSPAAPRAISRGSVAQDVEAELRIICVESRKKYSQIKEHSERVIAKLIASNGNVPVEEVLAVVIVASETHNPKLVLPCLGCVQRLIMGQLVNTSKLLGTVVTYLHDRANDSDPTVQVKALQTILLLLTPSFAPLLTGSEIFMEQLLSACVILLGSDSGLVRHTAVACLRQVADFLIDEAGKAYRNLTADALENLGTGRDDSGSSRKGPSGSLMVEAMPVPDRLPSGNTALREHTEVHFDYYSFLSTTCALFRWVEHHVVNGLGEQQWGENGWWNWEGAPNAEDDQKWLPGYDQQGDGCWNQDTQYNHGGGDTNAWSGDGPWQGRAWTDQQQGSTDPQETPAPEPTSEEPATKKPRSASKSPDAPQPGGSTSFVNALRKLFKAKNAAPAKPPPSNTATTNNPSLWEAGKGPDNNKPQGGGALASLLAKQASGTSASSTAKAPSPGPSPGSPSGGPSDTELRKNVLTRLLSSDNAGELLEDPKVVEMLLQVASQLDETGLADLQKSVVKIITKLQSSSSAAANGGAGDLPPDQLAKRNACVERLKAILEGLRGLFLKRQEERINQGKASAAAAAAAQQSKAATTTTSTSNTSHSALASLLSGVSAQNQPIYDHKVWTGYVQRSGVNKAKVNLYATLPVHSLTTDMVAQLGNELNLKLRVPDNEVLHQRQIHSESSSLLLMKADSAADQAELNAQIAYFNGRSRSGVAKLERDGVHYAAFMIPPGPLAEKLIGSDNYKRCNPDDMATVCMITKSDTVH